MTQLKRGKFISQNNLRLYNETAYIIPLIDGEDIVMAQFDNLELPISYTHGWVVFHAKHFEILEEK